MFSAASGRASESNSECRPDGPTDGDSATGAIWSSGCRSPETKLAAELLAAHGYTPRHVKSRTDEGFEKLRSWQVNDFPGWLNPGKSEER